MSQALRILIAEDSEADAMLLILELRKGGYEPAYERVETPEAMSAALDEREWDVVIADYVMPEFGGLEALEMMQSKGMDLPFIVVSGKMGEETAVEAMKAGASDYILKNNLSRLVPAIERELREAKHRRELRQVEETLSQNRIMLQSIIDGSNAAICIRDTDSRVIMMNTACEDFLGIAKEEAIGKTDRDFLPRETVDRYCSDDRAVIEAGTPCQFEEAIQREDGVHTFVSAKFPVRNADGGVFAVGSVSTEITERKRAEEALQESVQEFRVLAESIPQIVWATRPDGWNIYFNQQWVNYTGMTLEESYGHGWNIPFHPDDRQRAWEAWQNAVKNDEEYSLECRLRRADGAYRWWLIRGSPLRDASGKIVKWFGTCTDIQDIKEAEEELAKARAEAEQQAAEFQSFVSSMADGLVVVDLAGECVYINEAGRRMLDIPEGESCANWLAGYERYSLEGEPFPREETAAYRALQGETVTDTRYRVVAPWGKEMTVSASASPILDARGRILGATVVFRDQKERIDLEVERKDISDRDHRIAEVLQQALIPPMDSLKVETCSIAVKYEPALKEAEVGGDFYDFFDLGDGRVGIVIGDVAGKGLVAAAYVAAARHAIRNYAYLFSSPAKIMTLTNEALCKEQIEDQVESSMLTAYLAIVDTRNGVMTYANAGHESPVVRDAIGNVQDLDDTHDIPLAVTCGYEYSEASRTLGPGDTVVIVTDGITEARPNSIQLFGIDGVVDFLRRNRKIPIDEIPSRLLETARSHAEGHLKDDAAIVVFACDTGRNEKE